MKHIFIKRFAISCLLLLIVQCTNTTSKHNQWSKDSKSKNEVIVLGAIHGAHLTDSIYTTAFLEKLIIKINPDIILTEIPPDRFDKALEGFKRDDSISEPRVMRFPEYTEVVFPLMKKMDFEIIPTAGWTSIMAQERREKLIAISKDSSRIDDWKRYLEASKRSDSIYRSTGKVNDPAFIHTALYDSIQDISLQVYNELFNKELGLGGWDNINIAHYWNIEKALVKYRNQGKRMLIIYGAGHKGWFLRELHEREDIILLEMQPFIDAVNSQ